MHIRSCAQETKGLRGRFAPHPTISKCRGGLRQAMVMICEPIFTSLLPGESKPVSMVLTMKLTLVCVVWLCSSDFDVPQGQIETLKLVSYNRLTLIK